MTEAHTPSYIPHNCALLITPHFLFLLQILFDIRNHHFPLCQSILTFSFSRTFYWCIHTPKRSDSPTWSLVTVGSICKWPLPVCPFLLYRQSVIIIIIETTNCLLENSLLCFSIALFYQNWPDISLTSPFRQSKVNEKRPWPTRHTSFHSSTQVEIRPKQMVSLTWMIIY